MHETALAEFEAAASASGRGVNLALPPALVSPAAQEPAAGPVPAEARARIRGRLSRQSLWRRRGVRDLMLYLGIAALVGGAYAFTRLGLYDRKSDVAYWLGVAGGVGMLLLLTYPMRKHLRFMQRMGHAKFWFAGHIVLGIAGPLLILLHSNFHTESLNAAVAFYSMITVALSGIVGRYLYLHLHGSLSGERLMLSEMNRRLHARHTAAARLKVAPLVMAHCQRFEARALGRPLASFAEVMRTIFVLPVLRRATERACRIELQRRLLELSVERGWSRRKTTRRLHEARRVTRNYLVGAQRVALLSAWERLFSWWHVAHVPFVFLLALSSAAHVIAVHAY